MVETDENPGNILKVLMKNYQEQVPKVLELWMYWCKLKLILKFKQYEMKFMLLKFAIIYEKFIYSIVSSLKNCYLEIKFKQIYCLIILQLQEKQQSL